MDVENGEVEVRLWPTNKNNKQAVFVYNTIPYTTKYNLVNVKPALEQSGTERIHVDEPVQVRNLLHKIVFFKCLCLMI